MTAKLIIKLINGLNMWLKGKKIMLIFLASCFVVNRFQYVTVELMNGLVLEYIG